MTLTSTCMAWPPSAATNVTMGTPGRVKNEIAAALELSRFAADLEGPSGTCYRSPRPPAEETKDLPVRPAGGGGLPGIARRPGLTDQAWAAGRGRPTPRRQRRDEARHRRGKAPEAPEAPGARKRTSIIVAPRGDPEILQPSTAVWCRTRSRRPGHTCPSLLRPSHRPSSSPPLHWPPGCEGNPGRRRTWRERSRTGRSASARRTDGGRRIRPRRFRGFARTLPH